MANAYEQFLAGISLARKSMDVVLNGVAHLNAGDFYAAKDMGATAREQVVDAYNHF